MVTDQTDLALPFLYSVRGVGPLISAHRATFDRDRRLPDVVIDALADAGLFRLWLPRTLGGPELSPIEFMRVVEAASALDGSVGWLIGNGGGMSRVGGYLPISLGREMFANQRTFVVSATGAIGTAMPVDGGYRITGRWPFASGAPHGTHFMGLVAVGGPPAPDRPSFCCYLDRQQVTIHDTWHVSGLRGTGSSDFEVHDAFVPVERLHPFVAHEPTDDALLYRMPPLSVFAWTVSVVPLGIARGAIDAFVTLASTKSRLGSATLLRDRELVQSMVGRVEAQYDAARSYLEDAMIELMAATDIGGERLVMARTKLRTACTYAAETSLRIVDMLATDAGTAAIFENGPLERAIRDVQAAAKHVAMNPASYTVVGRLKLGLDPGSARF